MGCGYLSGRNPICSGGIRSLPGAIQSIYWNSITQLLGHHGNYFGGDFLDIN